MCAVETDLNLLIGILSLQMDFISRDQLINAMSAWVVDKSKPLDEVLHDQQAIDTKTKGLIRSLVERHIELHGDDAQASLATLDTICWSLRNDLASLADTDIDSSLTAASPGRMDGTIDSQASDVKSANIAESRTTASRYQVMRPHAMGGLGMVYIARDRELNREVALKEIQERYADLQDSRARFLVEAEVTGRLEHPGIVPVYGLGAYGDGRPYYAMRFIRGESLKEAATAFHVSDEGQTSRAFHSLAFRKLLRRFVDVCHALQYAHSRGVIHRDLKPSNIMLGNYGETLVVDWGLAKTLGQSDIRSGVKEATIMPSSGSGSAPTMTGEAIGTPGYMSPEQAAGQIAQITGATDVYSLGATLYHMLTHRAPVKVTDLETALERVRNGDFPQPQQLDHRIPRALDAICMKAMHLDSNKRYESPLQLCEDVESWLADEATGAYREPLPSRCRRWLRKHPIVTTGMAATVVFALVGMTLGMAAVSQFNRALESSNRELSAANHRESTQRERAESNFNLAMNAVETYLSAVTENDRLQDADFNDLRSKLLETAVPFYEKFLEQSPDDERVRESRSRAYFRLGNIYQDTRQFVAARRSYEAGLKEVEILLQRDDVLPEHRRRKGMLHNNLGLVFQDLRDEDASMRQHQASREARESLVKQFPDSPEYQLDLVGSLCNIATRQQDPDPGASRRNYEYAIDLLTKLVAADQVEASAIQDLSTTHMNLGNLYFSQGQFDAAREQLEQSRDVGRNLVNLQPSNRRFANGLASTYYNLGLLSYEQARYEESAEHYRSAIELLEPLAERFPSEPKHTLDLAGNYNNLAVTLKELNQLAESVERMEASVELLQRLCQDFPDDQDFQFAVARAHGVLALALRDNGDLNAAERELAASIAVQKQLAERGNASVEEYVTLASNLSSYGKILTGLGKLEEAKSAFQESIDLESRAAAKHPNGRELKVQMSASMNSFGMFLRQVGDPDAAAEQYRAAIEVVKDLLEDNPEQVEYKTYLGGAQVNYGNLLEDVKDEDGAIEKYSLAIDLLSPIPTDLGNRLTRDFLSKAYAGRAGIHERRSQWSEAATDFGEAVQSSLGDNRSFYLGQYSLNLARCGRTEDAVEVAEELAAMDDLRGWFAAAKAFSEASHQSEQASQKDEWATRAIALLQQVREQGIPAEQIRELIQNDPHFTHLKDRKDFTELLQ